MNIYNLKSTSTGFQIAKFDEDMNLINAYNLEPFGTSFTCSCPAGPRPSCRHRLMLPRMIAKANTAEFYCYETQLWMTPLPDDAAAGGLNEGEAPPAIPAATPSDAGEAPRDETSFEHPVVTKAVDLLLHGNPALEGKLTGLAAAAPTIRRR